MTDEQRKALEQELLAKHGAGQAERISRGLDQMLARWRVEDGDAAAARELALAHFVSDPEVLRDTARRLEYALEMLDGHANEAARELQRFQSLDEGPLRPVDRLLAALSPKAHIEEDLFRGKVAFVVLLNFPLTTLEERLRQGKAWSRERWALDRLASRFEHRVPAEIVQEIDRAGAQAESYIDGYNIQMDQLVDGKGQRRFPAGLKLISHWGLRDEIRAQYAQPQGLARQRTIARVMERIIRQEIPAVVIDSASHEWDAERNLVRPAGAREPFASAPREDDLRYRQLLAVFQAMRQADPYYPNLPTHMDRVFSLKRELPEARARKLLESVLTAPEAQQVAALVRQRLGRPLEPFDIWYSGFRPAGGLDTAELDRLTRERYPTVKALQDDLPRLLGLFGFSPETSSWLAERIVVDPARGPGHAYGAKRRDDKARLRTRFGKHGLDYKGFNIAIHELGHNVEQVFSISRIDHTLLEGVPNTAFTEAFAFLFQARDLALLGRPVPSEEERAVLRAIDRFWSAFEISGVALVDIELWHWMYRNPQASPAELRQAAARIAGEIWNRYYAPVFGSKDAVLLAIYSHIIAFGLYTPDYPLGFVITSQIEEHMRSRNLAEEMERMCRLGRLTPDAWMQQAVGQDVSTGPLLAATRAALAKLGAR